MTEQAMEDALNEVFRKHVAAMQAMARAGK